MHGNIKCVNSILNWFEGFDNSKCELKKTSYAGILDCRRNPTKLPYTVAISIEEMKIGGDRWCELPPRYLPFGLILDLETDIEHVCANFYPQIEDIQKRKKSGKTNMVDKRDYWQIEYVVVENNAERFIHDIEVITSTCSHYTDNTIYDWILWRPNPVLLYFIEDLTSLHPSSEKNAIDIGCGSGRDCVFLAKHGWNVVGVDQVAKCCTRAALFASNHGVEKMCRFVHSEFGKLGANAKVQYMLVVVCRTQVDDWDAIDALVAPGGVVTYHHFMEGCTHPHSGLLQKGALCDYFGNKKGYLIHCDLIRNEPSDNRPLSFFIAQKAK